MQLLAIDIGGTYSRFAHCEYQSGADIHIVQVFEFATQKPSISTFHDLLHEFEAHKPAVFHALHEYESLAIAIAGPVMGRQSNPPNINWTVNLDEMPELNQAFLLNDFVAQAYGLMLPEQQQALQSIRHTASAKNNIALIGAGTGLGHCLLMNNNNEYRVIPSEAGQACFAFHPDEKPIEDFILKKTRQPYVTNDMVVSGSGLELMHECLTGEAIPADVICLERRSDTLALFSRFYARACRNFCLSLADINHLVLSGGIAARHPELVNSSTFLNEFNDSPTHKSLLEQITVSLNLNQVLGLLGAAYFALSQQ